MRLPFLFSAFMALCLGVSAATTAVAACNADIVSTRPDGRYIDHGDGTVTDTVTGLMWKQCSEGLSSVNAPCDTGYLSTFTWRMALDHADAVNRAGGFAGYTDWRLPNYKELFSLVELKCYDPAINTTLFPDTVSSIAAGLLKYYWTSSPYLSDGNSQNLSWAVFFYSGVPLAVPRTEFNLVRLVRGQ